MRRALPLVFLLSACPASEAIEKNPPPEAPPPLVPPLSGPVDPENTVDALCYRVAAIWQDSLRGTEHENLDPNREKVECESRMIGENGYMWREFYECVDRAGEFSRLCIPVPE